MIYKERELIKSALLEVEMRELRLMESAPDVSIDASDEYTCKINDIINIKVTPNMITTNLDLNTLSREKPRAIIFFIVPFDTSRVKNSAINIATNNSKLEADKKLVITSLELRLNNNSLSILGL